MHLLKRLFLSYSNLISIVLQSLIVFSTFSASFGAHAGVFEVSGSGSWRKSSFDKYNYNEMTSWTGSFSYYFMEMSALELSYTDGVNRQSVKPQGDSQVLTVTNFQLTALDMVITLADKEDTFQPYFKLGGGYLNKSIFNQVEGFGMKNAGNIHGWVPSAGIGLKWFLTKDFSIRLGLDAWTSPPNQQPVVVDYAGRAGLSILL